MKKYLILLTIIFNHSFAMIIPYGEINEISKSDVLEIIKLAEKNGIKQSAEINKIRSWRDRHSYDQNYSEYLDIDFKPHKQDDYSKSIYTLYCNNASEKKWICEKKEKVFIRFDLGQEKNILVYGNKNLPNERLVEVARAANNLRPKSWEQSISTISAKPQGDYRVRFGNYASYCVRSLTIRREFDGNDNLYSVIWGNMKYINSCSSIGGYIDTTKLYVIYENDEWISDKE